MVAGSRGSFQHTPAQAAASRPEVQSAGKDHPLLGSFKRGHDPRVRRPGLVGLGLAACQKGLPAALWSTSCSRRATRTRLLPLQKQRDAYKLLIIGERGFISLAATGSCCARFAAAAASGAR
jgi:hypothetical protein